MDTTGTDRTTSPRTPAPTPEPDTRSLDFIRQIVADDLREGRYDRIVTRFPPEPNGYLHIGHATSIALNFGIAEETGGRCHLRFDDTNPETEEQAYVESIIDSVRWLGFDWGEHLYFASDYFDRMYGLAEFLVRTGRAYVDSQTGDQIRENRGTVTEPGVPSPFRGRAPDESLDLLRRMKAGEFEDGAHVLRAKIDMASPNMLLRDPVLYRIRHAHHYRTGDRWCIYPLYDYAHPIEDAIEGVTHSICTLEFENNRAVYDWVVDGWRAWVREQGGTPSHPHQYEFARRTLDYTVVSKRKLLELVRGGHVSGWDDPRMPTVAGLRRRGVTPEAIRAFARMIGIGKAEVRADFGKLEYAIRDDLNRRAPRVLCVLDPLRVVLANYPQGQTERLDAPYYPHDVPLEGSRELPFSRTLYIERDDFREDPPKGFHRLTPGGVVRLRYGYIIRCDEVVRDDAGEIVELRCSYLPETRGGTAPEGMTVRGTIHWVSAEHALPCEVRLYDRLFQVPDPDAGEGDFKDHLNPESLVVVERAWIEPSVADHARDTHFQFERTGYFLQDSADSAPDRLVFNRTVTLRDTWAKRAREQAPQREADAGKPKPKQPKREQPQPGSRAPAPEARRSEELQRRRARYRDELGLADEEAEIVTRDRATAELFEAAVAAGASPRGAANWTVHELPREIGGRTLENLPFSGAELGELVVLVEDGTLSSSAGQQVLAAMVETGEAPAAAVERLALRQISDQDALAPLVDEVLAKNPAKVDEYRGGKAGLLGFFIGQVMRATGGKANPELTRDLLQQRLEG